ncbi:MAG: hypothetical protein Q9194_005129 [Teloschistes cf. exilis]
MDMGHGMGGMSMGDGVPNLFYLQKMYWAVVGTAIGCATLANLYNKCLYRQRMLAAWRHDPSPAKPRAILPSTMATITATIRELMNGSSPLVFSKRKPWRSPTLGRISVVIAELILVIVLCFYRLNPHDQWQWEDIGYRTGFIATAQLPLVVLLAGKRNIIGWLTGTSYERLNWLHRWVSRILFLTVTIHMGFWFVDWARYDYIMVKLTTDAITQRGFAAWCILLWIVLSSFAPVRRLNYEFFVVQHIVTFVGFFAAVYLHLPQEVKVWIWIPIGFFILDRALRAGSTLLINFLLSKDRKIRFSGRCTHRATFEPLTGDTTRITITNPPFRHWKAGQHMFLSCHGLAPLQAHPFTIASLPSDGKLDFLVKMKSGSTKRFFRHAEKGQSLPIASREALQRHGQSVILEGPYGRIRPLRQFDSVFLIAGGSGATFTVPLLRDLVFSWWKHKNNRKCGFTPPMFAFDGAATRFIRFIWIVKSQQQQDYFRSQLLDVAADVRELKSQGCHVEVEMSVYVTCDDTLGGDVSPPGSVRMKKHSCGNVGEMAVAQSSTKSIEKSPDEMVSIKSMLSNSDSSDSSADAIKSCGPNGTCCCMQTVEDEAKALERIQCQCNCGTDRSQAVQTDTVSKEASERSAQSSLPTAVDEAEGNIKEPQRSEIAMLSGRPQPRSLIRKMLEQALGESAVVVCGPQGLTDDVRQSVVWLSNDRAVHKGNTGLGKEAVLQLAKHNPSRIYLAARTPSKGEAAIDEIKKAVPDANITYLKLDLCSFQSISTAAQEFKSQSQRLDILMNNAGIMATPLAKTEEGYESQFGTNHVGHALLTKLLLPTLLSTAKEEGSDVRIINLTSEGHRFAPRPQGIVFDQSMLEKRGPWPRYGQSKLANILFTKELAKRYPSITSLAVHPGVILTDLYGPNLGQSFPLRWALKIVGPWVMADIPTGALNQLWAAVGKKSDVVSGTYYTPIARGNSGSAWAQKNDLAQELWDWTEKELVNKGFS